MPKIENPVPWLMLILFIFSLVVMPVAIIRRQWDTLLPFAVTLCGWTFIGVMSSPDSLALISVLTGIPVGYLLPR